ncbi:putative membrane protein [Bosea sp. BE271]|nr:PACE efflux transporter [Bosea sp. 47.2.35]MDR6828010.1 putative membrane protein [Bosea robiniae]MDR6894840.1 putative membrane protein [Bosea sp. BE109]MDR7138116.1 putative membrane protein [Bosea sp. BE168]MDR7174815.1 putative membrane protein [Bosea sp. BE271]MCR4522337.1 PACE efflux transporter [Bosea sp. 47.2.35]
MSMRSFPDRVRHTVMFEIIGLALVIPGGAMLFNLPATHMGVIGVGSATVATLWNFVYNLGFDHAMLRFTGHTRKSLRLRVLHALLFEGGLLVLLLPPMAWYLGMGLWETLVMDLAIVVFYVVYAFLFNLAYDRAFPVPAQPRLAVA